VNCAILAASLFMVQRDYTFVESISYGLARVWLGACDRRDGRIARENALQRYPCQLAGPGYVFITGA
jgi:Na+-transporting NADH:ubiquinone oxidoreductase subunit NqrE